MWKRILKKEKPNINITRIKRETRGSDKFSQSLLRFLKLVHHCIATGDRDIEPQAAIAASQHAVSPRFGNRARNQIWRRSSFGPRVVSSATEARTDLTELETQVKKLVSDLSSASIDTVRNATGELRLLARQMKLKGELRLLAGSKIWWYCDFVVGEKRICDDIRVFFGY